MKEKDYLKITLNSLALSIVFLSFLLAGYILSNAIISTNWAKFLIAGTFSLVITSPLIWALWRITR